MVTAGETKAPKVGIVMVALSINGITSSELNYGKIKLFSMFLRAIWGTFFH